MNECTCACSGSPTPTYMTKYVLALSLPSYANEFRNVSHNEPASAGGPYKLIKTTHAYTHTHATLTDPRGRLTRFRDVHGKTIP